jgi:type IV secretory pathway TraG/TraD family ATPase VirD4
MFGEALRSIPEISPAHKPWSSAEWVKSGKGCIFLTFPPMMREQLRPLIGTWLDLLIYRLQRSGFTGTKTWIIVDEMPTLGLLPALTGALTENRKSGNPIVFCVQDKSQLDAVFGDLSSAMLSMPPTKIIFRTSEPSSAKWASQALGNVEYEQVRESESATQQGKSRTEHVEFVTRPLVMPEQLDGLPPLNGYIKHGNLVTDLETCYPDIPRIQPGFVPRTDLTSPALPELPSKPSTEEPENLSMDGANPGLLFE